MLWTVPEVLCTVVEIEVFRFDVAKVHFALGLGAF